ncbi:hypothetical protein ACQJBY_017596 [Aegilops geniculata]
MAARTQAWQFAAALAFFHGSEYVLAAAFHGHSNVTATSLLISKQYVLAMSFAMVEHLTESLFFPEIKGYLFVSNIGLLMVLVGEIIRKIAVVTAGRAFTHVIRIQYEDQHQLIYAASWVFRLSSMGSWNAVFIVIPSLKSRYEEFFLRQFFGSQYEEYARKVHSGLPFIN